MSDFVRLKSGLYCLWKVSEKLQLIYQHFFQPREPDLSAFTAAGSKRPAVAGRKDELLKELKAVEDAIARKRAKID